METKKRDYYNRLTTGNRLLPKEVHKQWENFVTTSYEQNYNIDIIDIILLTIRELNTDDSIRIIIERFKQLSAQIEQTEIIEILNVIAKLHFRGIHLMEYYTKENEIELAQEYIEKLRKTREIVMLGEDYEDAEAIASYDLATLSIANLTYEVLISEENYIYGVTPNGEIIIGIYYEDAAIIYIIDKTKKVAYYQIGDKAIEVSNKTGLTDNSITITLSKITTRTEELVSEYNHVFEEQFRENLAIIFEINKILTKIVMSKTESEIKTRIQEIIDSYLKNQKRLQIEAN